jgi:diguanylate cyclase (GGDEF)-like protein
MSETKKNTILIVDDESVNLKILNHILGQDYTIYTAANGKNAVEKAMELKPDLIILDILMPEMDGYETLTALKNCDETKKIPVIFITGLSNNLDEEKGLSLDAADYIPKPFSAMIVKLRVRNQIQIVNQLRTIEHLSLIDQLTQIPNRRNFDERLSLEWRKAVREKTPISLLMIDIDNFKNVNDSLGHQKGDFALQRIAEEYPKVFKRPADFAARWGGEEFIALLPNTPMEGALEIAERIRLNIENLDIPLENGLNLKITVSIGVNSLIPNQESSIDAFLSNTDMALYSAKDAGRNRVIPVK